MVLLRAPIVDEPVIKHTYVITYVTLRNYISDNDY